LHGKPNCIQAINCGVQNAILECFYNVLHSSVMSDFKITFRYRYVLFFVGFYVPHSKPFSKYFDLLLIILQCNYFALYFKCSLFLTSEKFLGLLDKLELWHSRQSWEK